ncbi:hypothetical protein ACFQ2B_39415 [Streptomyces stramineus]
MVEAAGLAKAVRRVRRAPRPDRTAPASRQNERSSIPCRCWPHA